MHSAGEEKIMQVVGDVDIYDQLLSAPPLIHTINQKDIVSSVSIVNT